MFCYTWHYRIIFVCTIVDAKLVHSKFDVELAASVLICLDIWIFRQRYRWSIVRMFVCISWWSCEVVLGAIGMVSDLVACDILFCDI